MHGRRASPGRDQEKGLGLEKMKGVTWKSEGKKGVAWKRERESEA